MTMKSHPAADIFPMFGKTELAELAGDIGKHGLIEAIVTYEGSILDGRNRYLACEMAKVEPRYVEWDGSGGSPILYVVSKNLHRRHLTPGQRTAIGLELLPLLKEEAKKRKLAGLKRGDNSPLAPIGADGSMGKSSQVAAKAVQVGARSIERLQKARDADPEALERVKKGETTVNAECRKIRTMPVTTPGTTPRKPTGTGKRRAILENAMWEKLAYTLGMVDGYSKCLNGMSAEQWNLFRSACRDRKEGLDYWVDTVRAAAHNLRKCARTMEGGEDAGQ